MDFFEFEDISVGHYYAMSEPHDHEYYELYFLLDGEREFFVENKMFKVSKNTLVVVPPFTIHKTEGNSYRRININISSSYLSNSQIELLKELSQKIAVKLDGKYHDIILRLLNEGSLLQASSNKNKTEYLLSLMKTILLFISLQDNVALSAASTTHQPYKVSPEVLKIISYINTNYNHQITLKVLCDKFFLSKVSLCKKFKDVMKCSIMEYVNQMRLSKAKLLLRDTNKTIEEIALDCGFSSANYFGLIFKKEVGLSPLNYKKTR